MKPLEVTDNILNIPTGSTKNISHESYAFSCLMFDLFIYVQQVRMMTSSNGNIFRVTGHLCGEFTSLRLIPAQRPVTRSFDVFFDLRQDGRLSKQLWGWWFETPSRSLWRHSNACDYLSSTMGE